MIGAVDGGDDKPVEQSSEGHGGGEGGGERHSGLVVHFWLLQYRDCVGMYGVFLEEDLIMIMTEMGQHCSFVLSELYTWMFEFL